MTPNLNKQSEVETSGTSTKLETSKLVREPKLQWQRDCLVDLAESDMSYAELALKYDRARDTIMKLREQYNITRPTTVRKGAIPLAERKTLSPNHRAVGVRLTLHRNDRLITELADEIRVSRTVYKAMEVGAHDFTLTQLLHISDILEVPPEQLWTPITMKATQK